MDLHVDSLACITPPSLRLVECTQLKEGRKVCVCVCVCVRVHATYMVLVEVMGEATARGSADGCNMEVC